MSGRSSTTQVSRGRTDGKHRWTLAAGTAVLLVALAIICALLVVFVRFFLASSNDVKTATIAGMLTVLASVISVLVAKDRERRIEAEHVLRERKARIYSEFMRLTSALMAGQDPAKAVAPEGDVIRKLAAWAYQFLIWAPDRVLRQFVVFRRVMARTQNEQVPPAVVLLAMEELYRAIRQDIGHKNAGLAPGDLLAVFINEFAGYATAAPPAQPKSEAAADKQSAA